MPKEMPGYATCSQCQRFVAIIERSAFGGRDKLRMTLSCGHVVLKAA